MNNKFSSNIINSYGEEGRQWLLNLPNNITIIQQKYNLTDICPVNNMTYNYIAQAKMSNNNVILKIGINEKALTREAQFLQAYTDNSLLNNFSDVVKVIACSPGMLILSQALPGNTLKSYFPNKELLSIKIVCDKLKKLHLAKIPTHNSFYSLEQVLNILDAPNIDIPELYLRKARQFRDDLLKTTERNVLLHGDLHHDNLLQNGDGWQIIDPKGFIGDPVFDAVAFIKNPIPELTQQESAVNIIKNRIKLFADIMGWPEQRILKWIIVGVILSWIWQLEDNLNADYFSHLSHIVFNKLF